MPKYIDAEKLVFEPDEHGVANGVYITGRSGGGTMRLVLAALKRMVEGLPTEDVAPVAHGRWIELPSMAPEYECSECRQAYEWWEVSEAHYCPNCGAKMNLEVSVNGILEV